MAIIQTPTRAARGLSPYESPKADWDTALQCDPEVLVAAGLSTRRERRIRQRNLAAMGRKSRLKADRLAFAKKQSEQSLRGQARVYFRPVESPAQAAMFDNVNRAVYRFAEVHAEFDVTRYEASLTEVEGMLRDVAVAYGDLDPV